MKTLVLSDETYAKLTASPSAKALLLPRFEHDLPSAEELHTQARLGNTPTVFELQRERMEAIADAQEGMRDRMHELIRAAHARGVGPAWLARWSGYDPSRIYQILGG